MNNEKNKIHNKDNSCDVIESCNCQGICTCDQEINCQIIK